MAILYLEEMPKATNDRGTKMLKSAVALTILLTGMATAREMTAEEKMATEDVPPAEVVSRNGFSVQIGLRGGLGSLSGTPAIYGTPQGDLQESANQAVADATFGTEVRSSVLGFYNGDFGGIGAGIHYGRFSATGSASRTGLTMDATTTADLLAGVVAYRRALDHDHRFLVQATAGLGLIEADREISAKDDFDNRYTITANGDAMAWLATLGGEMKIFPSFSLAAEIQYVKASADALDISSKTVQSSATTSEASKSTVSASQGDLGRVAFYLGLNLEFGNH